jgi:hypothetical protein
MKSQFFSMKIQDMVSCFHDTGLMVSSPINKSEINANVLKRLKELNLRADVNSFNYVIRENQLWVEGWAYENKPVPVMDFLISE